MSRGMSTGTFRMAAAMAFAVAAFQSMAQRHEKQQSVLKAGGFLSNDPTSGAGNYRGGPGNRAHQRAALKKRNQARHRRACRG